MRQHHRRPGGHVDPNSNEVEQSLLQEPVRKRMGADEESGRCAAVEGKGRCRHDPGCLRQVEEACADHADHGSVAADGPCLREDLAALLRASGPVCGRVCSRLVQAHAPRHGADPALPRRAGAEGNADLAGPDPAGESSADRRKGCHCAEGEDSRFRPIGVTTRLDRLGVGLDVPSLRQTRRRERRAHSPQPTEGLGGQPAGSASRRRLRSSKRSRRSSARRSRSPT